jgi:2-polyprenyl-3-methyl-5-hydroxy-6-metoxy-1,4-benzoquinol methylase
MADFTRAEFTGERVVPGQVEPDLWNEHVARYAFAARFASGRRVLDAGCGMGYGSALLARAGAAVVGLDVAREAVESASRTYAGLPFVRGSCSTLPFAAGAFDLIVAFEVIEHLHQQQAFIAECRRVLAADGLLIVSTPNTLYYAESRADAGPNPFHEHEFEAAEFQAVLQAQFAHVALLLQNRTECFAFYSPDGWHGGEIIAEAGADRIEQANFFVALCSNAPFPAPEPLLYIPRVANLLRERERHIRKLEGELAQKDQWLADAREERDNALHHAATTETALEESNQWAERISADLAAARQRIVELQAQFAAEQQRAQESIDALDAENRKKTEWALQLAAHVETLTVEVERLRGYMTMVTASRWVRAGHKVGLGPPIPGLDSPRQ